MLLSEALAQRKQALADISTLSTRVGEAAVRYTDDIYDTVEDPEALMVGLDKAIEDYGRLTIQINKTNNVTTLAFDGQDLTIMEAITLREQLLFTARHYRTIADGASTTVRGRSRYGATRTKDDIKQVAAINVPETRQKADTASETARRLDIALQQKNWTTELV